MSDLAEKKLRYKGNFAKVVASLAKEASFCLIERKKYALPLGLFHLFFEKRKKLQKNSEKVLTGINKGCILIKQSRDKEQAICFYGILAQLGEHLPYKQRVTGSSPVGPIFFGGVAQLARAHGSYPWCRGFKSPLRYFDF